MTAPPLDALGRAPGILPIWARYSRPQRVSFAAANVARDVPHTLNGAVPTGMLVLWADAEIHAAPGRVWTETTAYLQANAAVATATVVFVLARETPTTLTLLSKVPPPSIVGGGAQGPPGPTGSPGPQGPQGIPGEEGPPGGSSSVFFYRADVTSTTASDPGSGKIKWNHTNQHLATELYVDWLTDNGFDATTFFQVTETADVFVIQDADLAINYQKWRQTGPAVMMPDWFRVPVTYVEGGGDSTFSQLQELAVILKAAGEVGPAGPAGPAGPPGPEGPPGGGADLDYSGAYVPATTYDDGDIVIGSDGIAYLCVKDGVTTPPEPWPGGSGGLIAHHLTHEPGGSDVLLNAAWTNVANTFTPPQTINGLLTVTDRADITQIDGSHQLRLARTGSAAGAGRIGADVNDAFHVATEAYNFLLNVSQAGVLTVNGFGDHTFSAAGSFGQSLMVENLTTTGASQYAQLYIRCGTGTAVLRGYGPSYSSSVASQKASGGELMATGAGGLSLMAYDPSGAIRFYTGGTTERMVLDAAGGLTINTPGASHSIIAFHNAIGYMAVGGYHYGNGATAYSGYFYNGTTGAGQYIGNAGVWVSMSDRSLKTDIRALDVVTRLRQLQPRDFLWKAHATSDRPGQRQYGFVAQEVEDVFPDLVTRAIVPDTFDERLGIAYTGLIAPLVQGWQAHDATLRALDARLTELEGR